MEGLEFGEAEGGEEAEDGENEERDSGDPEHGGVDDGRVCSGAFDGIVPVDGASDQSSADDGEVGEHVDRAVGLAQMLVADQFGDHSVFCGTEEGALDGEEDEGDHACPEITCHEGGESDGGDADFRDLGVDGDASLAEFICELASEAGEKDEGDGEAQGDVALATVSETVCPDAATGDGEDEDLLQDAVVDRTEELGEHEGEEALVEEFIGGRHDGGRRCWPDELPVPGGWKFRSCTLSDGKARANRNRGGEPELRKIRGVKESRRLARKEMPC